jgi:hypothetical protein
VTFSARFHWDLRPNRIARAVEERRRSGARILDLTESNPTHAGIEYPADILRAFEDPRMARHESGVTGNWLSRHRDVKRPTRGCWQRD